MSQVVGAFLLTFMVGAYTFIGFLHGRHGAGQNSNP